MSAVNTGTPLKVAAYCRVSTNHPDQLHSLEVQVSYEPEAKVVRMIFQMAADGAILGKISTQLHELRIPTPRGGKIWSRETLRKMLQNEKYVGNVMLQKSYVHDYFKKTIRKNSGELERYVVEENHEGIIQKRE